MNYDENIDDNEAEDLLASLEKTHAALTFSRDCLDGRSFLPSPSSDPNPVISTIETLFLKSVEIQNSLSNSPVRPLSLEMSAPLAGSAFSPISPSSQDTSFGHELQVENVFPRQQLIQAQIRLVPPQVDVLNRIHAKTSPKKLELPGVDSEDPRVQTSNQSLSPPSSPSSRTRRALSCSSLPQSPTSDLDFEFQPTELFKPRGMELARRISLVRSGAPPNSPPPKISTPPTFSSGSPTEISTDGLAPPLPTPLRPPSVVFQQTETMSEMPRFQTNAERKSKRSIDIVIQPPPPLPPTQSVETQSPLIESSPLLPHAEGHYAVPKDAPADLRAALESEGITSFSSREAFLKHVQSNYPSYINQLQKGHMFRSRAINALAQKEVDPSRVRNIMATAWAQNADATRRRNTVLHSKPPNSVSPTKTETITFSAQRHAILSRYVAMATGKGGSSPKILLEESERDPSLQKKSLNPTSLKKSPRRGSSFVFKIDEKASFFEKKAAFERKAAEESSSLKQGGGVRRFSRKFISQDVQKLLGGHGGGE